jgi:hypothetical protein
MRQTTHVKVPEEWGKRDAGKIFQITEWSAERAEKWGIRAVLAYNRGGGQIPMDVIGGGMEAIFILGINTFLRGQMQADEVIPIIDELLECVKLIRDPNVRGADGKPIATDIVSSDDIEEIKTRLWLRSEVLRLHTNFSPADAFWSLISAVTTVAQPPSEPQTSQS